MSNGVRKSLVDLQNRIAWLGTDLEEKDIELRDILHEFLVLINKALPQEAEDD